jgi:hypothetical protein
VIHEVLCNVFNVYAMIHIPLTELTKDKKDKRAGGGKGKSSAGGGEGGASSGGGVGASVLSADSHENMRSGLASVMSTLDDMLEDMKKKKK